MSLAAAWRQRRRRGAPLAAAAALNPPGEAERLLRRLDFTVVRRLDGLRQGDHRNAAYGAGLDLAELREYQPGDDVRAIDWNVTARMAQPYVRRYHEDRDVTAWLVLDLSASTDFGSAQQTKRERLIDVAGTLARLLTARGDRVGALLYTGSADTRRRPAPSARARRHGWWAGRNPARDREAVMPAELVAAGGGRTHTLQLLQRALDAARRVPVPGSRRQPEPRAGTDLGALLEQAFRTARQSSLVVVLSDFLDSSAANEGPDPPPWSPSQGQATSDKRQADLTAWPPSGEPRERAPGTRDAGSGGRAARGGGNAAGLPWERALGVLARRHEVVGVWLVDAREVELPDVGVVTFEDAETGEQVVADTSQPSFRAAYAALARRRAVRLEDVFARSGAALWRLSTAEPLVPALVVFLEQRRRTLLGAQRLLAQTA